MRRRWVVLTPEEWVRQHAVVYLMEESGVPAGLMAIEKVHLSGVGARRTDITVSDRNGKAWMIVECKAPTVTLKQVAVDQVIRYAAVLRPRYVAVTNGNVLLAAGADENDNFNFMSRFPLFPPK